MLFMVIERFKDRDPIPVYRRVRDQGIKFPEGLTYVGSWIEPNFDRCFQLMECDDVRLIQQWILNCQGTRHDLRDRAGGAEQGDARSRRAVPGLEIARPDAFVGPPRRQARAVGRADTRSHQRLRLCKPSGIGAPVFLPRTNAHCAVMSAIV